MDLESKVAFYERQKTSWAGVRELCEEGASRVAHAERLQRLKAALQIVENLENEASAMLHRFKPEGGTGTEHYSV